VDATLMAAKLAAQKAVMCFLIDITERKNNEEALRNSEMRYKQLVNRAHAGIYEIDLTTGNFIYFNDAICETLGYSREEFQNLRMWDVLTEASRQKQLVRVEKMLKGEPVPAEAETDIIDKNGNKMSLLVYTKIEYKDGLPVRANTVAHNITERKRLEEELSKAQKLESLGVMAGGIGHDFNNLLSGIMGNISLAKIEAERGENIMESLDEALRVASKASALTRQLLVFSKGGAPVRKAASITDVLHDSTAFTLRGSKVKCKFKIPKALWPVKVDVGQFSQVIQNLVINAMQAMSGGGEMRLEAKNVNLNKIVNLPLTPGRYVVITFQDQGRGIAQESLTKIFDPYFTTKSKGSGLGLTMSYMIIKRHDGHMTVESEVGRGTTFKIYLPATEEVPAETDNREFRPAMGDGRILVMDDEESLRKVAEKMLLKLGYAVQCARDGAEAIKYYKRAKKSGQPFDAVIMDLTIPGGMGGKKTIAKLLEIDPGAVAVVSSGYSTDPILANYEKYGFCGAVTKPYRIEELSWVMHDVLKGVNR
jgi:PAS domain S-box-containing protein